MTSKKPNKTLSKNFLIFIIISLLFWFLTKLSKTYQSTIEVESTFINLPLDKQVKSKLPKTLDVTVKASGFKLFYSYFFTPKVVIDCTIVTKDDSVNWLDLDAQKNRVQSQLGQDISVLYFNIHKIKMEFEVLATKKIKVNPNISITFKDNFDAYGQGTVTPDSIIISGPKGVLDTLQQLDTEKTELLDVDSNVSRKLSIHKRYKNLGLSFKQKEVDYTLDIEKYTEGSIEVPFSIINEPKDISIKTFPNLVKLSYRVRLKDYNKVNENLFLIECNYKESKENGINFLIPKVVTQPDFIKDLNLKTQKIDFFITK